MCRANFSSFHRPTTAIASVVIYVQFIFIFIHSIINNVTFCSYAVVVNVVAVFFYCYAFFFIGIVHNQWLLAQIGQNRAHTHRVSPTSISLLKFSFFLFRECVCVTHSLVLKARMKSKTQHKV